MKNTTVRNAVIFGITKSVVMVTRVSRIKLQHMSIPLLIDAAYACGLRKEPVHVFIAAEPGCGKTWGSKSIEQAPHVNYFSASYSPNEYKIHVKNVGQPTRLFIHDDVGRISPSYVKDFISAFCDLTEGHIEYRQYKKNITATFNFSTVFTSTLDWYYSWRDTMIGMGFLDRVVVFQVELDDSTREEYQALMQIDADEGKLTNDPAQRIPIRLEEHKPQQLFDLDIDPRNLRNLLRLSKYLNKDQLNELIAVTRSDKPKYSI